MAYSLDPLTDDIHVTNIVNNVKIYLGVSWGYHSVLSIARFVAKRDNFLSNQCWGWELVSF